MVKKYNSHMFKGTEIRVSTKIGLDNQFWATAFGGIIVESAFTRSVALVKAKKKILKAIKSIKKR